MPKNIFEKGMNRVQKIKVIFGFISIALLFVYAGCSEYDSSVGGDIVAGMRQGVIKEIDIPVDKNGTFSQGDFLYVKTPALIFGRQNGIESQMFLKFNLTSLPDSIENISEVKIKLYGNAFLDSTTAEESSDFDATIHQVLSMYSPMNLTYETLLEDTLLATLPIGTTEREDSIEIDFNIPVLQSWIDDTLYGIQDDDSAYYGIVFKPSDNATFLKRFVPATSTENDKYPKMLVTLDFIKDGVEHNDSLFTLPTWIARYMVNDATAKPDDREILSKGFVRRMIFQGEFEDLNPDSVSINRVDLVLHADTLWNDQFINDNDVFNFSWRDLVQEWDLDPIAIDSIGSTSILAYSIQADTNMVRINITPKVSQWILDPAENFGVELWPFTSTSSFSRMAFYNNEADSIKFRPYFHVIYTEYQE